MFLGGLWEYLMFLRSIKTVLIKYYDMMMYFYAFEVEKETYTDEHGLCVCYPTEYVGTAEEEKLKSLLDEVAKSFKLI